MLGDALRRDENMKYIDAQAARSLKLGMLMAAA